MPARASAVRPPANKIEAIFADGAMGRDYLSTLWDETLAMDLESGHPANRARVESKRRFRSLPPPVTRRWREDEEAAALREEEEAAALREKLRLEKRERPEKERREKEWGKKKRLQKKELNLQRNAASSGAIGIVASEVTSTEFGPTRLETLSLNDASPALDSTVRAVVHASDMGIGLPDSTIMAPSADEALSPRLAELREHEEYMKEHTFDTAEDLFEFLCNSQRAARAMNQAASEQSSLEKFESQPEKAQPVQAPEEARQVLTREETQPAQEQYSKGSNFKEEVARAGMKWMIEEVMVAFKNYLERKDDLKDCDYKLDELRNQCFSVENYHHNFHHFNFTVNMKTVGSTDWTSVLYFAEVKEIFGRKIYFYCPLEPEENGHCYACKNQGIDDLKHPIVGAFDRGGPNSTFPFAYDAYSDVDDEEEEEEYDEAWRMRMRAAGVMVG